MTSAALLHDWTALEQSRAVRAREVSVVELTAHYLTRTSEHNDAIGAFAHVAAQAAMAQARELDRQLLAGELPAAPDLFGVVAPVKDLDPVAGMPCTYGSRTSVANVPDHDAAFVTRMRRAGLVITGKTTTPEFGLPAYTENDLGHVTRTPWDLTRSAGGSSGGAAAAVAARLASVAQGSDGGGSIRIPASVTGLVGIKPSRGRVSDLPFQPGVGELGVIGPLARTVADAAALLDVLAGSGPADVFGLPPTEPGAFLAAARRDPGRLRIGRFRRPMVIDTEVHADALAGYEQATALMLAAGHEVEDIDRPISPDVVPAFETVWQVGAATIPVAPDNEALLTPLTRHLRQLGRQVSGVELMKAVATMREASSAALAATAPYDVLLTPTLARPPARLGEFTDLHPEQDFEAQKRFTPFTAPFNVTGQPAMSIPLHHTGANLPVGVQLVGRPRDEQTMISLAAQLEGEVSWHERIPPLPDGGDRDG